MVPSGAASILTDVTMCRTIPTASVAAFLLSGPRLFGKRNLLESSGGGLSHGLQLTLGMRGTHLLHGLKFGVDSYSYLVEGEVLWLLAPPECSARLRQLLESSSAGSPLSLLASPSLRRQLECSGVVAVHQRAGDALFMPGGWLRVSQSLCSTVSLGSCYLRAWKLEHTLEHAAELGQLGAERGLNLNGVFETLQAGNWGVSNEHAELLQARWAQLQQDWSELD